MRYVNGAPGFGGAGSDGNATRCAWHRQSDEPKPLQGNVAPGSRLTRRFVRHSPPGVQGQTQILWRLATSRK